MTQRDPPEGWLHFGTMSAPPLAKVHVEFSDEADEAGMPLYERPLGTVIALDDTDEWQIEMLSAILWRELGSFLAHSPHDPDKFWRMAAQGVLSGFIRAVN